MQFTTTFTALLGTLLASGVAPVIASPVDQDATVVGVRDSPPTCGESFGAPLPGHRIGDSCKNNGEFACSLDCANIIECHDGKYVFIASCGLGKGNCASNKNGGAVCAA